MNADVGAVASRRKESGMSQYMLSVHMVEGSPARSAAEIEAAYRNVAALNADLQAAGAWVFAGGLLPPSAATVVRVRDGDALVTDGPFAEGKEHIGGFWVIDAADLDIAIMWATKATQACGDAVEVRPFQEQPAG
jgi:hypothetical protein